MSKATLDVLTTCPKCTQLCERVVKHESPKRVRHWSFANWDAVEWSRIPSNASDPILIVSCLSDLPVSGPARQPRVGSRIRKHLIFAGDLPIEALPSRVARLSIRDDNRLHVVRKEADDIAENIIRRTISGLSEHEPNRIVDAWWEADRFVILSPEFDRLSIPHSKLSKFIGKDPKHLEEYHVDEDGSFVCWSHADAHLGWMQFKCLVDPAAMVTAQGRSEEFNRRYGLAVRSLRESFCLRQSDIGDLTARQVSRIEAGECRATHASLNKLAKAHNMSLNDYLDEVSKKLTTATPTTEPAGRTS